MRWLAVAVVLLVAGCADSAKEPADDAGSTGFLEAQTDDVNGAVTGVVVDESVVPIAGAIVALVGQANATTDAEGRFAFEGLQPGTYFLDVSAARHLATQTSVDVKAGQTAKVKVSLLSDGLPDPYKQTHHFNGIIHVHATVAWAQLEWMLDSTVGLTTPACECAFEFTSDAKPQGHVYEAIWEESTPPPTGPTEYYWQYSIPDPFHEVYGYAASPIYRTWNEQPWPEETGTYKALLLGPAEWVAVEQDFEIFMTHWFHTDVPEGWGIQHGDS